MNIAISAEQTSRNNCVRSCLKSFCKYFSLRNARMTDFSPIKWNKTRLCPATLSDKSAVTLICFLLTFSGIIITFDFWRSISSHKDDVHFINIRSKKEKKNPGWLFMPFPVLKKIASCKQQTINFQISCKCAGQVKINLNGCDCGFGIAKIRGDVCCYNCLLGSAVTQEHHGCISHSHQNLILRSNSHPQYTFNKTSILHLLPLIIAPCLPWQPN